MHRRGIRVLPGGDYGFAWAPHGTNAMDLQYFVKHLRHDADGRSGRCDPLRRADHADAAASSARSRKGISADLLLVDGDPLADVAILLDRKRLLAIMKDGVFHKAPEIAAARTLRTAVSLLDQRSVVRGDLIVSESSIQSPGALGGVDRIAARYRLGSGN